MGLAFGEIEGEVLLEAAVYSGLKWEH